MAGGVKFIAVRQSLGMQGGGQARLFARNCSIIILSEICFCFHFSLYSSVCIFVRLWQEAETGGGGPQNENRQCRGHTSPSLRLCKKRSGGDGG